MEIFFINSRANYQAQRQNFDALEVADWTMVYPVLIRSSSWQTLSKQISLCIFLASWGLTPISTPRFDLYDPSVILLFYDRWTSIQFRRNFVEFLSLIVHECLFLKQVVPWLYVKYPDCHKIFKHLLFLTYYLNKYMAVGDLRRKFHQEP